MKIKVGTLRALIREAVGDEQDTDVALPPAERQARWQSKRPSIEHLSPGQGENGEPLFHVGDRIVVDRKTKLLKGEPWLETIVGRVKNVDPTTGVVSMYDEESDPRSPKVKHFSMRDGSSTFKLAPTKGDPFEAGVSRGPGTPIAATPGKTKGTYKIYGKKGAASAHTRLKGKAYVAGADTKFKPGDSASLSPEDGKLRVKNDDADQLWEPTEG